MRKANNKSLLLKS